MAGDESIPLIEYLYELPRELIAQSPASPRDSSRLMRVPRSGADPSHQSFRDLDRLLKPGDLLVTNETEVIPARLRLHKTSGGRVELMLLRPVDADIRGGLVWEGIGKPGAAFTYGRTLVASDGTRITVLGREGRTVTVRAEEPLLTVARRVGEVPLPPYIRRPNGPDHDDSSSYQAVFARQPGSAAAPTASLHFTARLLDRLKAKGIKRASLVLHVGLGTFLPIDDALADDVRQHQMHAEWFSVPTMTQDAIRETKAAGGRVIAVGTTVVRALETLGHLDRAQGETELFIYPGFEFKIVDGLITNFHLPGSTLLLLVSAFSSSQTIMNAYRTAVAKKYRFFSYGDAMLID
ncbi:MAG: tRNA preQ1(34) S-adenosylmethionine ribosyltransferase-isomerase QueA [Myxococcota bacterium]